ncbi:MAG: hypothetical protein KAZ23_01955 [Burkholderiaceae bacterium]|nr:hypothetical protein [Burkholderiaceae bacterium]
MPMPTEQQEEISPEEQKRLDDEARARQDVAQNPRMQAMAAIEADNERRIHDQLVAEGLDPGFKPGEQGRTTAIEEDPPIETAPRPTPAPTAAPTPPAPAPAATQGTKAKAKSLSPELLAQFGDEPIPFEALDQIKVRVPVDGEMREMTLHDVRRTVQLDGAAQKRLQQANELMKEAQQRTASATPVPTAPPVGVAPAPASRESAPASTTEEVNNLVSALFNGDEDTAKVLLGQILAGSQQAADPASLAQQAAATVRQQLSVDEANSAFRSAYSDIVGDQHLARAADGFYDEVMAEFPHKSYAEVLMEAGQRTRDWMASKGIKTATGSASGSTRQEKQQRKERIDEVRSLNRTPANQEVREPTPSEVIAEMRKERGLA